MSSPLSVRYSAIEMTAVIILVLDTYKPSVIVKRESVGYVISRREWSFLKCLWVPQSIKPRELE